MDPCPHFLSSYIKVQQRNGINEQAVIISQPGPSLEPSPSRTQLGPRLFLHSYVFVSVCRSGQGQRSFLTYFRLYLKLDFDGIKQKMVYSNGTIQLVTSQSPKIAVAIYSATFVHILVILKRNFDGIKEKIGLLNQYNLTSHLASHQLVSHNCHGQQFCYFWPYLSHFKSDFGGKKRKSVYFDSTI